MRALAAATTLHAALALPFASAFAAEISEPARGIVVDYDASLWSGKLAEGKLEFACQTDACGGPAAGCSVGFFLTKAGLTASEYGDTFSRDYTRNVVDEFAKLGLTPIVIDSPTSFMVGANIAVQSSIRYDEASVPTRVSFFQINAPFGVVVASCYLDEDKYDAAHDRALKLVEGIRLPKS